MFDNARPSRCREVKLKVPKLQELAGVAMVLGKLPVPGRLTNLDDSRARAYCACSGCRCGDF